MMKTRVSLWKVLPILAAVLALIPAAAFAVDPDDYVWVASPSGTCDATPALVLREIKKGRCSIVSTQGHAAKVKCVVDGSPSFMVLFDSKSACDAVVARMNGN